MKKYLRILRPAIILGIGLALSLIGASFSPSGSDADGAAALYGATTPVPGTHAVSQAGTTDGIMWMSIVIVIIILLPILLRKSTWKK
jgi:hypothetical protein